MWDKETLKTDEGSSVVAVLRQSYYLVVDLQSKAAYTGQFSCRCLPNCPLILQCIVEIHHVRLNGQDSPHHPQWSTFARRSESGMNDYVIGWKYISLFTPSMLRADSGWKSGMVEVPMNCKTYAPIVT